MNLPGVLDGAKKAVFETAVIAVAAFFAVGGYTALRPVATKWMAGKPAYDSRPELEAGAPLVINGESLAGRTMSVVLLTSPTCTYCIQSIPFHRALAEKARNLHIPFHIMLPRSGDREKYLKTSRIAGLIHDWRDLNLRVRGTPTVVLVDPAGVARVTLVGLLATNAADQVLAILDDPSQLRAALWLGGTSRLTIDEFERLKARDSVNLLDVRERIEYNLGHRSDAINIPFIEFPVRAPFELDLRSLQVLDCSHLSDSQCREFSKRISQNGLKVAALTEGSNLRTCQVSVP